VIENLDSSIGADHPARGSLEIHLARTSADWEIASACSFDDERNLPSLIPDSQESKRTAIELILKARPFP
jgi:hypothetical protein